MSSKPELVAKALSLAPTDLLIGGNWVPAASGRRHPVVNPATEEVLTEVAAGGAADGLSALDAAQSAAREWADTAPRARAEILRRAFELITARAEDFAALITLEMGKPLADALGEVRYGAEFFRWYAEEAVRAFGRTATSPEGNLDIITIRRPVGPCLLITPWNFPLAMATRKIAPALAAGCTCVLKPASLTPLSALAVGRVLMEAGVPAGVVNVVPAESSAAVSSPVLADPRLRKLSFTGSTPVGEVLLAEAAPGVLRASMELGGCAPFIVFADADLDVAVEAAVATKIRSNGEACNASNTFYVHESLATDFAIRLAERLAGLKVGDGLDAGVNLGPLVSSGQRRDVAALVDSAVAAGAEVLTGGSAMDRPGFFYLPTVLGSVPASAAILTTEIFGPVAPVTSFETVDEVLRRANSVDVGLAGYVYTRSIELIQRCVRELEVGMVSANTGPISNAAAPFGGVKRSGLGREGGPEGFEEYLDTVYLGLPRP
ncbi:MAG: NAD-dependent succinate-semialdehyde dehydrogenase [Bifidobacteriaceae bacterium]|jgi:succinate-semialdehyde dehydrogenase/glutarate-semialdehyde dehydrogenase|nr:NAD-dependent succinate-semialdehyde dehydrogenase [Bifidobacteriaceae bacterium]